MVRTRSDVDWLNISVGAGLGGNILTCVLGAVALVGVVNLLAPRR